jgi:thiosulfate reductase cytochrome b subunit
VIIIQTLAQEILAACPRHLSFYELWTHLRPLYYQENAFTFHAQLQKVMLLHQDVSAHEISSFIQLFKKEWAILYRLTTSTSQVNSESQHYRRDFATFLSHDRANRDFFLASLMEKFSNKIDNILTKNGSSF